MKTKLTLIKRGTLLLLLSILNFQISTWAQGTAFIYQGRLADNGTNANGVFDFQFRVFDTAPTNTGTSLGSPNPNSTNAVVVINGLFTVILDFGNSPFATGAPRWLDISVRTNGGSFSILNPRQALTAIPYAITASNITGVVSSAGLAGTYSSAVTFNNPANSFSGNGGGLTNLNASNISSGTLADGWLSPDVALLGRNQTFTGNNSFGNINVNPPAALSFGLGTRQMLNLYSTPYGIGVQNSALYFRTDDTPPGGGFAWFKGGIHNNNTFNSGGGSTLMTLSSSAGLDLPPNTALFSGLTVDDMYGSPHLTSDATNSFFLRARYRDLFSLMQPVFLVRGDGHVGIGTDNPTRMLEVQGSGDVEIGLKSADAGGHLWTIQSSGTYGSALDGTFQIIDRTLNASRLTIDNYGQIFWGTSYLGTDQHGSIELGDSTAADGIPFIDFHKGVGQFQDFNVRLMNNTNGQLSLFGNFYVTGNASACSLTIRGGCDLAEPFEMSDREIPQGSLVIIDEENPGRLKLAAEEYDKRVAGIVSGANGVNPGISLHQEGLIEGGQNVALSGRVYALADASFGAIKPGDLLTSSSTPGHVMKVMEHTRAQGSIVGKAMSPLQAGRGMVLVLVTLQ